MKTILILFFAAILGALAVESWGGKTLPEVAVAKKWGRGEFDESRFRDGNVETRASMAYSIISRNPLKGKTAKQIREHLGEPDGHYFSERAPAYLISLPEKPGDDVWQIVFLTDRDMKVTKVVVHKNCCE
jgi:hypothetical protein